MSEKNLSKEDIIRAWNDEAFRNALPEEIRKRLPANPADEVELSEEDLNAVAGGAAVTTEYVMTMGCCQGLTTETCKCSGTVEPSVQ